MIAVSFFLPLFLSIIWISKVTAATWPVSSLYEYALNDQFGKLNAMAIDAAGDTYLCGEVDMNYPVVQVFQWTADYTVAASGGSTFASVGSIMFCCVSGKTRFL